MRFFPESALVQLEYDKIKGLLKDQCDTEYAKTKADELRIHTRKEFIDHELKQTDEFKQLVQSGVHFPIDYILNLSKELKLLGIPGAVLTGENFLQIRKLPESIQKVSTRIAASNRRTAFPAALRVQKLDIDESAWLVSAGVFLWTRKTPRKRRTSGLIPNGFCRLTCP